MAKMDYDKAKDDYQEGGGNRWENGKHRVSVVGFKNFCYNTGTAGVEVHLTDGENKIKASFPLTEKALWKLASFAKAAGLTKADFGKYDTDSEDHSILLHRSIEIDVVENEKGYAEVIGWSKIEGAAAPAPTKKAKPVVVEEDDDEAPF